MSATIIILIATGLISYAAFNNGTLLNKFIFFPYIMKGKINEMYRFISHGFIHADMQHLLFNMITFFSFGTFIENQLGTIPFVIFYLAAIAVSSIVDFGKHQNHNWYRSLGASGGTSAVVFAAIMYQPWLEIWFIPGFIFGIIYLAYSNYASKQNNDNVGHDAHIYGALFGIGFILITHPEVFNSFIEQISNPSIYYRRIR
jgi:membrane associated rhomboid family serine protease